MLILVDLSGERGDLANSTIQWPPATLKRG